VPDDPERSHDTDPLADTQSPSPESLASESSSTRAAQRRSVHVGDTLGRYELLEDVGEGGMATVYRARDKELRRDVAVKVMFPHLARRDDVVRRFHREARAAAGLEHANILRVYDVGGGDTSDPPYIVMELVRGLSLLGEIEQRGPMLAEIVACIGAVLAEALTVAHKAGIIHRDIKPANILIDSKGRVLLADFGVARLETEDSLVTKTGALLGTPAYMSPEQASGDTATSKSDLYSLGATLYQLSTGSLPYSGSPAKVMAQIATGPPVPAVKKRATVGPDLSRVIDRLMAHDAAARPETAALVATELRSIASAAGFGDPADELAAYFTDPKAFIEKRAPAIVATLVTATKRAIADNKLPRAMALADRASSLAPDDPAVKEIIDTITEGGRASRRRRVAATAGIGLIVAGGATFGAMQLLGGSPTASQDAAVVAMFDAGGSAPVDVGAGSAVATATDDAGPVPMIVDAGIAMSRARDAGVASTTRHRDAAVALARVDAGRPTSDAANVAITPTLTPDASVAGVKTTGFILVKNDTWCTVTIDDVGKGTTIANHTLGPIEVDAGGHTVKCEQGGTRKEWTRHVDVQAGKTATATGSLLGLVNITLEVDATVNGTAYTRGQVVSVKAGRVELVVGGKKAFVTVQTSCRVRAGDEVGCY
jgi:eukaryotic-like serine/threonine-protein kinase